MAGGHIGTIFVELDLDPTRYLKGQKALLREGQEASKNLERNFQNLGIKSDATFDLMRSRATLAYNAIKNDARTTFSDMMRAHQAYGVEMQRITMEQFQQEKNLNEQRKQMSRDSQAGWVSMMKGMLAYRVIMTAINTTTQMIAGTFKFLANVETATLGIGAAFMTAGKYIDTTTGKALEGAEALKVAQVESKQVIEELKAANLATIATLDELIVAYQQTLPVAMAKGFDKRQVKEFTLAMIQAAGAIGLPMNQLGEETRSMLTGAINPRTSRIATVLGLRNEDIAQFKGNAQALFDFLMDRLKAYQVAGIEAQTTWAGLWSNAKDLAFQFLGEGMQPVFDAIKRGLTDLTQSMITVDAKTKQITWNPEFLKSMETMKSAFTTIVTDLRRIVMLVDILGAGMAMLGKIATLGMSKFFDDMLKKFTERVQANERVLMDMAMESEGYKRGLPKPGQEYEAKVAINKEEMYFQDRTLWYYKELKKETTWVANKAKEDADALKKAEEERIRLLKLDLELTEKQRTAREEYANQMMKAEEDATAALDKFVRKELVGEEKQLANLRAEMEAVNGKMREMFGITAETITIDERYLSMLDQLTIAYENRAEAIKEANIQERIANDETLKALDKQLRAEQEAETGYMAERKSPDEYRALQAHRDLMEMSYAAAIGYGDAYHAIMLLNDGLAVHYQRMRNNVDAVSLWSEAWNYANESTQGYINQIAGATMNMFHGMENAITDFVMTGKESFRDFANSVIADLMRIAVRASITAPLAKGLGVLWSGFGGATPATDIFENPWGIGGGMASGGPVSAGTAYTVGERGPEVFIPAVPGNIVPNGGGGGGNVTVNVHNNTGSQVSVNKSVSLDAQGVVIDMIIDGYGRDVHGLRSLLGGR